VGKGTFSVKGRYAEAAALCVRLLGPGGKLLCVTNHTKTTAAHLRGMLDRVALESTREVRYLKVLPSGLDCPKGASGAFPSKSVLLEVQ
jgi:23S rRNA G2069 N7-methylase RlmK/C1962 C5-methylase RlmI